MFGSWTNTVIADGFMRVVQSRWTQVVVNDDGPPSRVSHILPFVAALKSAGHRCLVVIPADPTSWIGKAHHTGRRLTAQSVCPAKSYSGEPCDDARCNDLDDFWHHWLVVDGPPASCTLIGMFHAGVKAAEFDLVVSGPNWGRNAGRLYNLSSGTVGGALEGALGGIRAIALSFASKEHLPNQVVVDACAKSVQVVESLAQTWHSGVDLYNVNIPMVDNIADCSVKYTSAARTSWAGYSLFEPEKSDSNDKVPGFYRFQWAPQLPGHQRQAQHSCEGEDLWALQNGFISVTPLRANLEAVCVDVGSSGRASFSTLDLR
ncbi:hypothetical protein G7046_g55 [Stylonectria norvegica]|nr:hypothetical protein G7046_g55 [Stylonectria norvegica]